MDKFISDFEWIFYSNQNLEKDMENVKKHQQLLEDREKLVEKTEEYLNELLDDVPPITLLSSIEMLYIGQNMNLIDYDICIHQFQVEFIHALILKYGEMKMDYSGVCDEKKIKNILKLSSIYHFLEKHNLHANSLEAAEINMYYRILRFKGFSDRKISIIKELFERYDKEIKNYNNISMICLLNMFISIHNVIKERCEALEGQRVDVNNVHDIFIFSIEEFKRFYGNDISNDKLEEILNLFIINVGDLQDKQVEEIYLYNPVIEKFIIRLEEQLYFLSDIGVVLDRLLEICETVIINEKINKEIYEEVRASYLEEKVQQLSNNAFPNSKIYINSQWDSQRHGENDCTVVIENYAIVLESKGGNIRKNIKKGIIKDAKNAYEDLIMKASEQAIEFSDLLKKNLGKKIKFKVKGGSNNIIDLTNVTKVITLGVLLAEIPLQNMSRFLDSNKTHIPIINIYQLDTIFSCLPLISEKIDYFRKRMIIEKRANYFGDEYDLLYTYLQSGFNTDNKLYDSCNIKEKLIINYRNGLVTKTDLLRNNLFNNILNNLESKKEMNWLDKALSVLELPFKVQNQIERELQKNNNLELFDNIKSRKKIVCAKVFDYIDCNTINDINKEINSIVFRGSIHGINIKNVLYLGFNSDMNCRIIKVITN